MEIKVEKPSEEKLKSLGVDNWSPWECESSTFDWEYTSDETAYVLEGKVKVETPTGEVEINEGDLVRFPKGLKCTWDVIKKSERFIPLSKRQASLGFSIKTLGQRLLLWSFKKA